MRACVFWCTWQVWKLNKDLSLTVGHVHNQSEIIRETGRWVDLPGPWSQRRQERRAIKPVRALNVTDIIFKKMEIRFNGYITITQVSFIRLIVRYSIPSHAHVVSHKYLSCHHTITHVFGSERPEMFKSDYTKTQRWVIKSTWEAPILRGFWEEPFLSFVPAACTLCVRYSHRTI